MHNLIENTKALAMVLQIVSYLGAGFLLFVIARSLIRPGRPEWLSRDHNWIYFAGVPCVGLLVVLAIMIVG